MVPSVGSFLSFAGGVLRLSESAIKVANPRDRSNQMRKRPSQARRQAAENLWKCRHMFKLLQTRVISWKLLQENFTETWTSIVADATSGRSSVLTINFDRCHSIDVNCSDPTPDTLECYNFHVQILSNILRCGQNPVVPGNHVGREWYAFGSWHILTHGIMRSSFWLPSGNLT